MSHYSFSDKLLGPLTNKVKNRLPSWLATELFWLNGYVYNFAKHHYNTENDDDAEPDHYFGLDEAIAVYLIVRKLGLKLEAISGKTVEQLMM